MTSNRRLSRARALRLARGHRRCTGAMDQIVGQEVPRLVRSSVAREPLGVGLVASGRRRSIHPDLSSVLVGT